MKKAFDIIKDRGYVYQATNEEKIREMFNSDEKKTFYLGIDPTADSLHIGHFFALTMVRRLQEKGPQYCQTMQSRMCPLKCMLVKSSVLQVLTVMARQSLSTA